MSDSESQAQDTFSDAVVWITGASSGIGEALALELSRRGARVVLSARRRQELERVQDRCVRNGAAPEKLLVLPLDIVDYDAMPAAVESVLSEFSRVDMLINNAGISQRSFCLDTDMAVYRKLFEVDVFGQIALTKQVLPVMVRQGSGRLVVTSSVAGKVGVPDRTGYCAAKHAVMGFFDSLRTEVAHLGIRVSTVIPGFINTNVSINALGGGGKATGQKDADIAGGMDVARCAALIAEGLAAGVEEIEVGEGAEMDLLNLKKTDPQQAFRLLETMARQVLSTRPQ